MRFVKFPKANHVFRPPPGTPADVIPPTHGYFCECCSTKVFLLEPSEEERQAIAAGANVWLVATRHATFVQVASPFASEGLHQ